MVPQGNVLIIITQPHKISIFLFFLNNNAKGTKMVESILVLKTRINKIYCDVTFLLQNK